MPPHLSLHQQPPLCSYAAHTQPRLSPLLREITRENRTNQSHEPLQTPELGQRSSPRRGTDERRVRNGGEDAGERRQVEHKPRRRVISSDVGLQAAEAAGVKRRVAMEWEDFHRMSIHCRSGFPCLREGDGGWGGGAKAINK